jgi:hypothetical protein
LASNAYSQAQQPPKPNAPARLLPEQITLRDQLRRTVAVVQNQKFNTSENNVGEMLDYCLALGCKTEVIDAKNNRNINGITCVCWNFACSGYEPLAVIDGHLAPRVGFGYQQCPSQMAAMLALSHVPANYPARSGDTVRNVADIIEGEKLTCTADTNMALKLVALSTYAHEKSWKNAIGEIWSIERMVASELDRPISLSLEDSIYRWMGISAALRRFEQDGKPLSGDLERAKQYEVEAIKYALRTQNTNGSWGVGTHGDFASALMTTGLMLEWLDMTLSDAQPEDAAMSRAATCIVGLLNSPHYQVAMQRMPAREIAAVMHAVHALSVYDERVFAPVDEPAAKPASAASGSSRQ